MTLPVRRRSDVTRVLLVDDDPMMRELADASLSDAGFDVLCAEDGELGLTLFQNVSPHIVLLDLEMPRVDGFSVCRAIRAQRGGQDVPIVVLTGRDDHEAIARAYDAGATDFVTKPVQFSILVHRLRYMSRATSTFNALRDSERRLADAQRLARIGHWEYEIGADTVDVSAEARRVLGATPDEEIDRAALRGLVHPEDRARVDAVIEAGVRQRVPFRVDHRLVGRDGHERVVHLEGEVGRDEATGVLRLIATIQDITDRKTAERRIAHLTNYDATTDLPNHRLILERLERALHVAHRDGTRVGVVAVDPDHFKRINDTFGHRNGDALLRAYAERLGSAIRRRPRRTVLGADTLGRSGAVGFVAILPDIAGPEELDQVARRIGKELDVPFEVDGKPVFLSSSFGLALYPGDGADAEAVLHAAATALGEAKSGGRGTISFYDDSLDARRAHRLLVEARLRDAIDKNAFSLVFQPKVRTHDEHTVGAEALIRWTDAELGFVSPAVFIPLAEECGLAPQIDAWVLQAACREAVEWNACGLPHLTMSVNISAEQFAKPNFLALVEETLRTTGLAPERLELELTEHTLMKDTEASIELLQSLRAIGVRIALDDFGTGYSSLSYLARLPIDTLKIDRSFVVDVHEHPDRAAIVNAIIAMSKSLDLRVVAEGVETERELAFLAHQRCDDIQGYYFSKPLPGDQFLAWCGARRAG